ncbi:MAG: UDP-N-acetylmuramoyl-L-alanyl-D-glutamate--2,6-diaminopimelate ligase [Anaerolineaceae bacterium]
MAYKYTSSLFKRIPVQILGDLPHVRVSGVTADSRQVKPGWLFVAIKGENSDGLNYLPQAIANGAVAVLSDRPKPTGLLVPYIQAEGDMRRVMAYIASALNNFPARKLRVIGITGTDGKTTTTSMIHHILTEAGIKAGMISTVSVRIGTEELDTGFHVTTPDSPDIQRYLAMMVDAGMTHCVLETTSHGLAQQRVAACDYDIAVITNVTHEHLDYHGTWQNYLEAKGKLFEYLSETPRKRIGNPRMAVLNKDDRSYSYLKRVSTPRQISYSMINEASLWADNIENTPQMLRFRCHISKHVYSVQTRMIGIYNVSNCLAALGATVLALGIDTKTAIQALKTLPIVPGRMETIDLGQDFSAIVDFAHTPNGLQRALETVRQLTDKRVIAVYGSAGLRDREKRRMMPKVSIANADISVLTAEDPRTESLAAILEDMALSAVEAGGVEGETFFRIGDRREAIRYAVKIAQPGDLVVVCGKGHEQSMCFGTTEYLWDDRNALKAALSELLGLNGPEMPYLPD